MTPAERSLRGRIGAYSLHAQRDPRETTAKARASFLAKFELQVDPDHVLPRHERQRRADAARRAHMSRLALRSAQARARKRARTAGHAGRRPRRDDGDRSTASEST